MKRFSNKYSLLYNFGLPGVFFLCLYFYGCDKGSSGDSPKLPNEARWKISSTVNSTKGSLALLITGTAGTPWSAEITEGSAWCSFGYNDATLTATKGTVKEGLNVLYVYYTTNNGGEEREAKVTFRFDGEEAQTFPLTQLASSQQNLPAFDVWAEIPAMRENADYQYVTHYASLDNKRVRNYSLCFDKSKKAALWVAYPIHAAYMRTGKRTDAWAFDPIIPEDVQANCIERSYRGSYDRGHQIASADRLSTYEMNAQTFYMSNMTPQTSRLNQDMWAQLEAKVRSNKCSDTLYVVTGAHFAQGYSTTTDGMGKPVPVPTHYYKLLLRTKTGKTGKAIKDCSELELQSIGFWVEHRSYGNIQPPRSICTTVADIEAKTGFKFFPQVPESVKKQKEPAKWGIN